LQWKICFLLNAGLFPDLDRFFPVSLSTVAGLGFGLHFRWLVLLLPSAPARLSAPMCLVSRSRILDFQQERALPGLVPRSDFSPRAAVGSPRLELNHFSGGSSPVSRSRFFNLFWIPLYKPRFPFPWICRAARTVTFPTARIRFS
jgi:hypothetical protein